jgi:hypothetical protein
LLFVASQSFHLLQYVVHCYCNSELRNNICHNCDGRTGRYLHLDIGVIYLFDLVRRNNADKTSVEDGIEKIIRDHMGILFLFESKGIGNIVLGSFGAGVFKNNVSMVARLWADLLVVDGAGFKNRFERVVFAILGKQTFDQLQDAFEINRTHFSLEEEAL